MRRLTWCMLWMLALLPLAAAQTQSSGLAAPGGRTMGDRVAGAAVAWSWCANCHDVGLGSRPTATDAAPGFRAIARMPSTTELSLRAFLRTPHANMPDYQLSRRELEDVIAYILSLPRD